MEWGESVTSTWGFWFEKAIIALKKYIRFKVIIQSVLSLCGKSFWRLSRR
jgi:hypothetical protein